jgi:hypothetical protein
VAVAVVVGVVVTVGVVVGAVVVVVVGVAVVVGVVVVLELGWTVWLAFALAPLPQATLSDRANMSIPNRGFFIWSNYGGAWKTKERAEGPSECRFFGLDGLRWD